MNQPITVIINSHSGSNNKDKLPDKITSTLRDAGRQVEIIEIGSGDDFNSLCDLSVKQAGKANGLVVAVGGDGTVNAVAALCYRYKAPMAVIPLGTFNYFARDLLIPPDIDKALDIIMNGKTRTVSVGFVQEHIFLNNASFGLYTSIIRNRELDKSRFGRLRIVAAWSAIKTLFKGQNLFSIRIKTDDQEVSRNTSLVFVGNNTFQLDNLGMEVAGCTQQNKLAIILMKRTTRSQVARIILRGAIKNLKNESKLEEFCSETFEVASRRRSIDVVIDGEIIQCRMPLTFKVEKNGLSVIVPAEEPAAA